MLFFVRLQCQMSLSTTRIHDQHCIGCAGGPGCVLEPWAEKVDRCMWWLVCETPGNRYNHSLLLLLACIFGYYSETYFPFPSLAWLTTNWINSYCWLLVEIVWRISPDTDTQFQMNEARDFNEDNVALSILLLRFSLVYQNHWNNLMIAMKCCWCCKG